MQIVEIPKILRVISAYISVLCKEYLSLIRSMLALSDDFLQGLQSDKDFTEPAHVFHGNCNEDGEERGKYAQDVADRIKSYMKQNIPVGFDIYDVHPRESESYRGFHRISRIIVEGSIDVKRID